MARKERKPVHRRTSGKVPFRQPKLRALYAGFRAGGMAPRMARETVKALKEAIERRKTGNG